jgi:hypothetical protein
MLRDASLASLWQPLLFLAVLGAVVVTLATLRFRSFLAPSPQRRRAPAAAPAPEPVP